jgi:5-methyltetrahydropteroyltriglutamate--homocysteine methyltransferase
MAIAHNLGFPRIGRERELKTALESFWHGDIDAAALNAQAAELRARHWKLQMKAGLDLVPVGDFALYDHMLETTLLLGAVPERFAACGTGHDLYFAMARGTKSQPALEMTKWFDTNYHYLVPELNSRTPLKLASARLDQQIVDAKTLGARAKVVLVGPVTWLFLGKEKEAGFDRLSLLPRVVALYRELLSRIDALGVEWVQIDEPALALDLPAAWLEALDQAYAALKGVGPKLLLTTYFGSVAEHADRLKKLPVAGLHLDLVRAPDQLDAFLNGYPEDKVLSLGVVDGRNVWRANLGEVLTTLERAKARLGDRLWVAASCSLLHSPVDLEDETALDTVVKESLAFATQKLEEIATLARGVNSGRAAIQRTLDRSAAALESRRADERISNTVVQKRLAALKVGDAERKNGYTQRSVLQRARLELPLFPTTTIGSFPQTTDIRKTRAAFKRRELTYLQYLEAMRAEIRRSVEKQEELGLDVLVHGEAERNDMVEYFGEQLWGFAFTQNGWVQSYGSRCVKPPIIYGDVYRPEAMTVEWARYAQSLTQKPVKGMLTGPVTILQWSFVRNDQPRETTALQIALAIRDEVVDLETAGIAVIQIDEPAFREGLPLKKGDWNAYLDWAVRAFRVSSAGVKDATQIHTHMCYSEFNDILPSIAALDADVITIETSRSDMELLDGFGRFKYPNEIGPGVYDIHSPRVPDKAEMLRLLDKALQVIPVEQLWVNPDCGLKTRAWPETEAALRHMVDAARELRVRYRDNQEVNVPAA